MVSHGPLGALDRPAAAPQPRIVRRFKRSSARVLSFRAKDLFVGAADLLFSASGVFFSLGAAG
jgi:hypothetical protein